MEKKTVNILGTEYAVRFDHKEKDSDGQAFFYKKEISLRQTEEMLEDDVTLGEKEQRQKEVFRHELFHAFFFEGTGADYAYDENLINFLAVNSPKIFKVFQELDIL